MTGAGRPVRCGGSILVRQARLVPIRRPVDGDRPVDLRIRDGMIVAVAPRLQDTGEPVLAADGRWVVPGLWDHHVHFGQWARTATRLDLSGARSADEVVDRVRLRVADRSRPLPQILVGFGHRSAGWPAVPSVAQLDAVSAGHPVVLISADAHNGWVNSAGLARLGAEPRTTLLAETDWFPLLARLADLLPEPDADRRDYAAAARAAATAGIVGITDMEFEPGFRAWPRRHDWGIVALRVRAAVYPEHLDDAISAGLSTGVALPHGEGLWTMGPVKVITDGSLNTATAYCREPYAAGCRPASRGRRNISEAELTTLLRLSRQHDLEVAVHAIGDAALDHAVAAFAASRAAGSIEHAQLIAAEHPPRLASLGLVASVQPAHLLDDRDLTQQCWPHWSNRCFALRSLRAAGVDLAFGSDAPVSRLDPWLAISAAVHRSGDERPAWHPEQSLTPAEALAASTNRCDTLRPGSLGDLAVLEADPLADHGDPAATASALRSMRVAATVVAGRVSHAVAGLS